MAPIGVFTRASGEYVIVHECSDCGAQRHCRIAADDDFALVLQLPCVELSAAHAAADAWSLDESA